MAALSDHKEATLWASLSVLVGMLTDGNDRQVFNRLESAARSFGLDFDELAARFDYHYYRPMDAYISKQSLVEARKMDNLSLH